jgi:predicted extracellular nuclease
MKLALAILVATLAACSGGGGSTQAAPLPPPGPDSTAIPTVQGAGSTSPLVDQDVVIEGVVTGDFQDNDADERRNLGGFYMQGVPDDDPETSDGIFVFDGRTPATGVDPGDLVRVAGTVVEYFGETQIQASAVTVIGSGAIQPAPLELPAAELERYEGMLVTFPQTLTVSQLRNLERFGEMILSEGGRKFSYTSRNVPSVAGYAAHLAAIESRRIYLDDGRREQNPGDAPMVRNGDEVTGLTGNLRYSRGSGNSGTATYRLMPTVEPQFVPANPRPPAPDVPGALRVATFNLNNFFTTLDTGEPICGPAGDAVCRGADSTAELSRQLAKIVTVMGSMRADIVAMVELENNPRASLQAIVDALNDSGAAGAWSFVDTGTIGSDAIKVGFIYRNDVVATAGPFAILDSHTDIRFDDGRHRPVLAQTFDTVDGGQRLTVLTLHLKSKGSSCASDGDPDILDGQSNCSATRTLAAAAIVDWIETDPTASGDNDFLVIGDFNAHAMSDAMARFETAGYTNVGESLIGDEAYSFEFDGQLGALDHAVASPTLAAQVVAAAAWHINADEARVHDYNLEFGRDPGIFDPSIPYRAADHDPLIIGIDLN